MLQSLPHFLLLYKNCYILIIAQKYEHKSRVTAHTTFPPNFPCFSLRHIDKLPMKPGI